MTALLNVAELSVTYGSANPAVDGVSLHVNAGETVGLVGESGSGKSTVALAMMRLLDAGAGVAKRSRVRFEGRDLLTLPESAMRDVRGRRMAMVFQEPASALNPAMRVGRQIAEVAELHGETSRRAAMHRAIGMLERVGIADAARRAASYPHELSGGQRQRVMIAMALLLTPGLLIADEPTSALDVTVQAQILELLRALQQETGMAVLLITHDLGVLAEMCDRAVVMQRGRVVESAPTARLFAAPSHPYTAELLAAVPRLSLA